MLVLVLQVVGFKVGFYIFFYYCDFCEWIKINGELMFEEVVVDFVEQYEMFFQIIKFFFFEIMVVMVFDYFVKEQVDWVVVEVGMGGCLDFINILMLELCVIMNISYDYM